MTSPTPAALTAVIAFLLGEAQLDGVWYGEKHPTERGAFWWRKHLRAAQRVAPISDERAALQKAEKALAFALEVVSSHEEGGEASESGEFIKTDLAEVRSLLAEVHPSPAPQAAPSGKTVDGLMELVDSYRSKLLSGGYAEVFAERGEAYSAIRAYVEALAAPQAPAAQPVASAWDFFPSYLIDHCEGETITEEALQLWASRMLKDPKYSAAPVPAMLELLRDGPTAVQIRAQAQGAQTQARVLTDREAHDCECRTELQTAEAIQRKFCEVNGIALDAGAAHE